VFYCFGAPLVGHGIHNYTQRDIKVAKPSSGTLKIERLENQIIGL
jgi:hypothetical protein